MSCPAPQKDATAVNVEPLLTEGESEQLMTELKAAVLARELPDVVACMARLPRHMTDSMKDGVQMLVPVYFERHMAGPDVIRGPAACLTNARIIEQLRGTVTRRTVTKHARTYMNMRDLRGFECVCDFYLTLFPDQAAHIRPAFRHDGARHVMIRRP